MRNNIMNKRVSITVFLLTSSCIFAGQKTYPFFDGTDANTEAQMQQAATRIEEVRKGDFSLMLLASSGKKFDGPVSIELASHDFSFGANLFGLEQMSDDNPAKITALESIKELFNTVIVCDYWNKNQPRFREPLDWSRPDYGNRLAKELDKNPRHHALIYGFPDWFDTFDSEEAIWQVIEQRIENIANHYGDKINEIDVINEFIHYHHWYDNPSAKYLSETHFPDMAEPENGVRVLKIARNYLPKAKLVVLEAGLWNTPNPVFQEIMDYHRKLVELGADYDYIGYQAHYYSKGGVPFQEGTKECGPRTFMMDEINRGIEEASKLGKPIVITEFNAPSRSNRLDDIKQPRISDSEIAAWEANFYTLMFSKPYIRGISRWFTIDNIGGRGMDAGVVTKGGELKPNYFALKKLIKEKWHTKWSGPIRDGRVDFRGYYGTYAIKIKGYQDAKVKLTSDTLNLSVVLEEK
jgi:GH35 family endo-1,4-beta-xylanase